MGEQAIRTTWSVDRASNPVPPGCQPADKLLEVLTSASASSALAVVVKRRRAAYYYHSAAQRKGETSRGATPFAPSLMTEY